MRWLVPFLLCASSAIAQTHTIVSDNPIVAFFSDDISCLHLHQTTARQALKIIQQEWERSHPALPFPVVTGQAKLGNERHRFSLDVQTVSYDEALRYVASQIGYKVSQKRERFILEKLPQEDPYEIRCYHIESSGLATLKLGPTSHGEEIIAALQGVGADLPPGSSATMVQQGDRVVLRTLSSRQELVTNIIYLLNAGFQIKKSAEQAASSLASPGF